MNHDNLLHGPRKAIDTGLAIDCMFGRMNEPEGLDQTGTGLLEIGGIGQSYHTALGWHCAAHRGQWDELAIFTAEHRI